MLSLGGNMAEIGIILLLWGVAVGAGVYWSLSARRTAVAPQPGEQQIRLSVKYVRMGGTFTLGFLALNLYWFWQNPDFWGKWIIVGALLLLAFSLSAAMHPDYDIRWNDKSVSGPRHIWLAPFGRRQSVIAWEDARELRNKGLDFWHLTDGAGNQITWSTSYHGCDALFQYIEAVRPDLMQRFRAK